MKTIANIIGIIRYYGSWLIMRLTNGRIMTATAIEQKRLYHEKRSTYLQMMQKALDEQHYTLRGWTRETDPGEPIPTNSYRETMLLKELKRTESTLNKKN